MRCRLVNRKYVLLCELMTLCPSVVGRWAFACLAVVLLGLDFQAPNVATTRGCPEKRNRRYQLQPPCNFLVRAHIIRTPTKRTPRILQKPQFACLNWVFESRVALEGKVQIWFSVRFSASTAFWLRTPIWCYGPKPLRAAP